MKAVRRCGSVKVRKSWSAEVRNSSVSFSVVTLIFDPLVEVFFSVGASVCRGVEVPE